MTMEAERSEAATKVMTPYSVREAAERLGISRNLVYGEIESGKIPSFRIGGRILIPRPVIDRLIEGGGAA